MKLEQLLTEGRDAPLYHLTTYRELLKIINENMLGFDYGTGVSLTRNKRLTRVAGMGGKDVVLVLDQRRISQRYKIEPFDEYGFEGGSGRSRRESSREDEEVVYKPIEPLDRYLLQIRILFDSWEEANDNLGSDKNIMQLYDYSDVEGVPIVDAKGIPLEDRIDDLIGRVA